MWSSKLTSTKLMWKLDARQPLDRIFGYFPFYMVAVISNYNLQHWLVVSGYNMYWLYTISIYINLQRIKNMGHINIFEITREDTKKEKTCDT